MFESPVTELQKDCNQTGLWPQSGLFFENWKPTKTGLFAATYSLSNEPKNVHIDKSLRKIWLKPFPSNFHQQKCLHKALKFLFLHLISYTQSLPFLKKAKVICCRVKSKRLCFEFRRLHNDWGACSPFVSIGLAKSIVITNLRVSKLGCAAGFGCMWLCVILPQLCYRLLLLSTILKVILTDFWSYSCVIFH